MHGKCGHANIQRPDSDFPGRDRTDGAAASQVAAHDESLHGNVFLLAYIPEHGAGFAVGGITLIGIELDHRTMIQNGIMIVVMHVRVIGMDAMGIVRGDQHGMVHAAGKVFPGAHDAFQRCLEKGTLGAASGIAAHFLMIIANQQSTGGIVVFQYCHESHVTTQQIIQPGTGNEILVKTHVSRLLHIIEKQFIVQNIGHRQIRLPLLQNLLQPLGKILHIVTNLANDGQDMFLRVDLYTLVGLAV